MFLLGQKKRAYGQALLADEWQYQDWVEEKSGRTNEISLAIYHERAFVVSLLQSLLSWDRAEWLDAEELQGCDVSTASKFIKGDFCRLLCIFFGVENIDRPSRIQSFRDMYWRKTYFRLMIVADLTKFV